MDGLKKGIKGTLAGLILIIAYGISKAWHGIKKFLGWSNESEK